MSKVRKLISITTIFFMCLTPIYGYARDATHYGMENPIVAQSPIVQPPVVGAVLKSLDDNQFYISSTIGKPELVPSIFTEANKSHKKKITDIISAFSMGGLGNLCTLEEEKIIQEEVQYVNTFLVDSEMYSNQKRITLVDNRIRGVVNNDIKVKTGGLITWPFELFHFQVPSFTSTTDKEMAVSMETAIETVQGVYYTRVFSNSNEENPSQKEEPLFKRDIDFVRCIKTALSGGIVGFAGAMLVTGLEIGTAVASMGVLTFLQTTKEKTGNILLSDFVCGVSAGGLIFLLTQQVDQQLSSNSRPK